MPGFESLILGEKTAVIFDFGTVYTKCGFAGECGPRFIFRTEITLPNGNSQRYSSLKTLKEKRLFFIKFIYDLYYRHLLVNPKDRRVVVVENVLTTTSFRNLLADVLYTHFEIPSALFAPSHLLALFTLGLTTGLVLECGNTEAMVIPVFEGYTLLNAWQSGQLGTQAIYRNVKELLLENAELIKENNSTQPLRDFSAADDILSNDTLEDILVRTFFVSPAFRAVEWQKWLDWKAEKSTSRTVIQPLIAEEAFVYPLSGLYGNHRLRIPSFIRELGPECLFKGDNDQITLSTLILKAIRNCPIDTRKTLAANLVLIGGAINIPGLNARLVEELNLALESTEFSDLAPLKGIFRVHQPPGNPNYIAWLGGAIFGALECLPGRSLERSAYLEKCSVPDWTSLIDTDPHAVSDRLEVTRQ